MARAVFHSLVTSRLAVNAVIDRMLLTADCSGEVSHPDTELGVQRILRQSAIQAGCSDHTAGVATLNGGKLVRVIDVQKLCRRGCALHMYMTYVKRIV